jgi:hypothetical protein
LEACSSLSPSTSVDQTVVVEDLMYPHTPPWPTPARYHAAPLVLARRAPPAGRGNTPPRARLRFEHHTLSRSSTTTHEEEETSQTLSRARPTSLFSSARRAERRPRTVVSSNTWHADRMARRPLSPTPSQGISSAPKTLNYASDAPPPPPVSNGEAVSPCTAPPNSQSTVHRFR